MTLSSVSDLKSTLDQATVPDIGQSLRDVGRVRQAEQVGDQIIVRIELGFPAATCEPELHAFFLDIVNSMAAGATVDLEVASRITAHGVQATLKPLDGVRNIIAVASGKGGVGKSTTAANLALALTQDGARVGVLDADIYGPSQPAMFGVAGKRPVSADGKTMDPLIGHGVQVMSIGFLIDPDQPMVWRGPMVTSALNQLLMQTRWDDLLQSIDEPKVNERLRAQSRIR